MRRWLAEVRGDTAVAGQLELLPEVATIPGQWREVVDAACEVLRGWRDAPPEAHQRVVGALVDGFDRLDWDMRASPENPRASVLARDVERAATEPPLVFAARAPALFARIVAEVPGASYAIGPVLGAIEALETVTDELHASVVQTLAWERWSQHLEARTAEWERAVLLRGLARIAEDLRRKQQAVAALRNQLGLELVYAGFGLDWTEGLFQPGVWATLDELAGLVEQNASLRRLADVLGRYEESRGQLELEEARDNRARPQQRLLRGGRSEVRGIHLGDELDRLTAVDLALLADPDLEMVFYLRFLEKRLLTYEMEGRETYAPRATDPRPRRVNRPREKGPILLCLDTSGSMTGEPELVAKTLCLALLRVALREERPCWAISFSSTPDLREHELTRLPENLPALLRFLATSFRGGTDPVPALEACLLRLETTTWSRADVLWVSDGIFVVPDPVLARVRALQATHDARFHVLLIGEGTPPPFTDVCWRWSSGTAFGTGAVQLVNDVWARSQLPP